MAARMSLMRYPIFFIARRCHLLRNASKSSPIFGCSNVNSRGIRQWAKPLIDQLMRHQRTVGIAGPVSRSSWKNWNYDSELFAFSQRVGEHFDEDLLRQAFTHESYVEVELKRRMEMGLDGHGVFNIVDNNKLAELGEEVASTHITEHLRYHYPALPDDGIRAICEFLLSSETLSHVGKHLGVRDLILYKQFPVPIEIQARAFLAVIGALHKSKGAEICLKFVQDFVVAQLIDRDLYDIWKIDNPMGVVVEHLKSQGLQPPEPRLIRQTGVSTYTPLYTVGLYTNRQYIAEGSGLTITEAQEEAARSALVKLFNTTPDRKPFKFEPVSITVERENLQKTHLLSESR